MFDFSDIFSSLRICDSFFFNTFCLRVGGLTVPFDIFAEFLPTRARLVAASARINVVKCVFGL